MLLSQALEQDSGNMIFLNAPKKYAPFGKKVLEEVQDNTSQDSQSRIHWRTKDGAREELGIQGCAVTWTRGGREVLMVFKTLVPVKDAIWYTFPPPEWPKNAPSRDSVVILDQEQLIVFLTGYDGGEYVVALPFKVKRLIPSPQCLLLERLRPPQETDGLPTLFSLRDPLQEIRPVLIRRRAPPPVSLCPDAPPPSHFGEEESSCLIPLGEGSLGPFLLSFNHRDRKHQLWSLSYVTEAEREALGCSLESGQDRELREVEERLQRIHLARLQRSREKLEKKGSAVDSPGFQRSFLSLSQLDSNSHPQSRQRVFFSTPKEAHNRSKDSLLRGSFEEDRSAHHRREGLPHSSHLLPPGPTVAPGGSGGSLVGAGSLSFRPLASPNLDPHESLPRSYTASMLSGALGATLELEGDTTALQCLMSRPRITPLIPEMAVELMWTEAPFDGSKFENRPVTSACVVRDILGYLFVVTHLSSTEDLVMLPLDMNAKNFGFLPSLSVSVGGVRGFCFVRESNLLLVALGNGLLHLYTGSRPLHKICFNSGQPLPFFLFPNFPPSPEVTLTVVQPQTVLIGWQTEGAGPAHSELSLPAVADCSLVGACVEALLGHLPDEQGYAFFEDWFGRRCGTGCAKNTRGRLEWEFFCAEILRMSGASPREGESSSNSTPTPSPSKRSKQEPSERDDLEWVYLQPVYQSYCKEISPESSTSKGGPWTSQAAYPTEDKGTGSHGAQCLSRCVRETREILHLVYEESKLDRSVSQYLPGFADLLSRLVGCDADLSPPLKHAWLRYYWTDFPHALPMPLQDSSPPSPFARLPQSILCHMTQMMAQPSGLLKDASFQTMTELTAASVCAAAQAATDRYVTEFGQIQLLDPPHGLQTKVLLKLCALLTGLSYPRLVNFRDPTCTKLEDDRQLEVAMLDYIISLLCAVGADELWLASIPVCLSLPLSWLLAGQGADMMMSLSPQLHELFGRPDKACLLYRHFEALLEVPGRETVLTRKAISSGGGGSNTVLSNAEKKKQFVWVDSTGVDGTRATYDPVSMHLWPDDQRLVHVGEFLCSSSPVEICIPRRQGQTDSEYTDAQEDHLFLVAQRTMALPVGRALFTYGTLNTSSLITLNMFVPTLNLKGVIPPRFNVLEFGHPDMATDIEFWPQFHNSVAAGLRVLPGVNFKFSVRTYDPNPTFESGGTVLGYGLNGHLRDLHAVYIHDLLIRGDERTTIGTLLGVSASHFGDSRFQASKMLSCHNSALLPPTSTELDIPPSVQNAAIFGVGLVFFGTGHRLFLDAALLEICKPPGPELENSLDRESYALSAGFAMGMIGFGMGETYLNEPVTVNRPERIFETLYRYIHGGKRTMLKSVEKDRYRGASYQIKETGDVNTDVTCPGATMALGMLFFDTGNEWVTHALRLPDTAYALRKRRPDHLMLWTIARNLVQWSDIKAELSWVVNQTSKSITQPQRTIQTISDLLDLKSDLVDFFTLAGACFVLGLRFAGSGNEEAFELTMGIVEEFVCMLNRKQDSSTDLEHALRSNIKNFLNVFIIAPAMIMAGRGELRVLRLVRVLRRFRGNNRVLGTNYGRHMVLHMALGLTFLGKGRFSLAAHPKGVASMLAAFYPIYPQTSSDNRYHLQALRHMWALAISPRLLIPRLLGSAAAPTYATVTVTFKNGAVETLRAPCHIPQLSTLKKVRVEDPRYSPLEFVAGTPSWSTLRRILVRGAGNLTLNPRLMEAKGAALSNGNAWCSEPSSLPDSLLRSAVRPIVDALFPAKDVCAAMSKNNGATSSFKAVVSGLITLSLHLDSPFILGPLMTLAQVTRSRETLTIWNLLGVCRWARGKKRQDIREVIDGLISLLKSDCAEAVLQKRDIEALPALLILQNAQ